jgi:hypothetical protein
MPGEKKSILQDWLLWLLANFFGSVAWLCLGVLPFAIFADIDNPVVGFLVLVGPGLMIGLAQWLFVIRWHIRHAGWWVAATGIGLPVGLLVVLMMGSWAAVVSLPNTLVGYILGAALGSVQWPVLRGKVRHAAWWIFASTAIWGLSGMAGAQLTSSSGVRFTLVVAESLSVIVLVWLLHRPVPAQTDSEGLQLLPKSQ